MIYNKVILLPWGMWLALVYNILQLFVLSGCSLCTMDGDEGVSMGENPSHHEQMQANSVLSSIIYIYIITSWKFEAKIQGPLPWSPFFFPLQQRHGYFLKMLWCMSYHVCMYVCDIENLGLKNMGVLVHGKPWNWILHSEIKFMRSMSNIMMSIKQCLNLLYIVTQDPCICSPLSRFSQTMFPQKSNKI